MYGIKSRGMIDTTPVDPNSDANEDLVGLIPQQDIQTLKARALKGIKNNTWMQLPGSVNGMSIDHSFYEYTTDRSIEDSSFYDALEHFLVYVAPGAFVRMCQGYILYELWIHLPTLSSTLYCRDSNLVLLYFVTVFIFLLSALNSGSEAFREVLILCQQFPIWRYRCVIFWMIVI